MLSERLHTAAVASHEKGGSSAQATKPANNAPNALHIASTVSRNWWLAGRNSKNMALSTGKLPPTLSRRVSLSWSHIRETAHPYTPEGGKDR